MKPSVATRVYMRFIACIDQRTTIHRIDAYNDAEKIGTLRNLKDSRIPPAAFAFNPHFPGAAKDLASDQKRQNTGNDPIPRNVAGHQVIVMATVAVPGKISVVLIKADLVPGRQFLISAACTFRK